VCFAGSTVPIVAPTGDAPADGVACAGVAFATVAACVATGDAAPALLPDVLAVGVSAVLLEQALSRTPMAETLAPMIAPRRRRLRRVIVDLSTPVSAWVTSSRFPFKMPPAVRFLSYIDPIPDRGLRDEESRLVTVDGPFRALSLNLAVWQHSWTRISIVC
jgi:hypothetical protein